jgi:hypothetical protein
MSELRVTPQEFDQISRAAQRDGFDEWMAATFGARCPEIVEAVATKIPTSTIRVIVERGQCHD